MTYFNGGEAKFAELLRQLEQAKHYIFVEYFIIDEGLMWGKVLELLARKAAEGVEVRVMYDGTCEFSTLPRDYPKRLEQLGIRCKVFAAMKPFVSTHYNYRDHRKIFVIDGRVGFTGGINLADEYINVDREARPLEGCRRDAGRQGRAHPHGAVFAAVENHGAKPGRSALPAPFGSPGADR